MKLITFIFLGLFFINLGDAKLLKNSQKSRQINDIIPLNPEEEKALSFLGKTYYFDEYFLGFLSSFDESIENKEDLKPLKKIYRKKGCSKEELKKSLKGNSKDKSTYQDKEDIYRQYYKGLLNPKDTTGERMVKCELAYKINEAFLKEKKEQLQNNIKQREEQIKEHVKQLKVIEKEIEGLRSEHDDALNKVSRIAKELVFKSQTVHFNPKEHLDLMTSEKVKEYIDKYYSPAKNTPDKYRTELDSNDKTINGTISKLNTTYKKYSRVMKSLNPILDSKDAELKKEIEDLENKLTIDCKSFSANPEKGGFSDAGYKGVLRAKKFITHAFRCAKSIPKIKNMMTKAKEFLGNKENFVVDEMVSVIDTYGDGILQFVVRKVLKSGIESARYLAQFKKIYDCHKKRDFKCSAFEKGKQLGYGTRNLFSLAFE